MPLIILTTPLNTSVLIQSDRIVSVSSVHPEEGADHSLITMTHGDPITVTEDTSEIADAILTASGS
jgi:hypothetical protein